MILDSRIFYRVVATDASLGSRGGMKHSQKNVLHALGFERVLGLQLWLFYWNRCSDRFVFHALFYECSKKAVREKLMYAITAGAGFDLS